jgi:acyl transferase domain-containing protein
MQQALRELRRAEERIAALERRGREPIAITGLGCRLPGDIDNPAQLWEFLARGGDAVAAAPADRLGFEHAPPGAFLADATGFDAAFFRIAPREARLVDPQQRLLLEVAHATIEHAGIAPQSLRGSACGVFVGISTNDWSQHLSRHLPQDEIDGAAGPGTNHCAAAGRLSWCLGLEGPSLAVNTACSSSLVALHLAVRALRAGECELALVLGVNVMLSPFTTLTFQRAGMLAPDGRCKTFAAAADGYGRGEGAVAALLAHPAAVQRLGLRVHAEVLGTATNQDGATAGLTVPSGPAQQRVLQQALADAGVAPAEVCYVEAHGTGTLLGDPIELHALAAVYGPGRPPAAPLWVGSCKTNFGHLEAAAGLLGVLKSVLQIRHRTIAPHLHFSAPNPHVPWSDLRLRVPVAAAPLPAADRALAGVSSFSFTGTNAHAIIAAPRVAAGGQEPAPRPAAADNAAIVLVVSAKTPVALRTLCTRWADHLERAPDVSLRDVAATAAHGRSMFRCRAAIVAAALPPAVAGLRRAAAGETGPGTFLGTVPPGDAPDAGPGAGASPDELAAAFVHGLRIRVDEVWPRPFQRLELPTYAFQHRQFRVPIAPVGPPMPVAATGAEPAVPCSTLRERLRAAPAPQQDALLVEHVVAACAAVLRLPADDVGSDEPLVDYGFDSILAVELANRLERDLGLPLPLGDLLLGASAADVAAAIGTRFRAAGAATAASEGELLRRVAALSPAEAERLLRDGGGP